MLNVARVLKKGGSVCFIDWLSPESKGTNTSKLHMGDISHKETKASYTKLLTSSGFAEILFEDVTHEYLNYVDEYDSKLRDTKHIDKYKSVISENLREELIEANVKLRQSIINNQQYSFRIRAIIDKPHLYK